jgi:hypothetical protein
VKSCSGTNEPVFAWIVAFGWLTAKYIKVFWENNEKLKGIHFGIQAKES